MKGLGVRENRYKNSQGYTRNGNRIGGNIDSGNYRIVESNSTHRMRRTTRRAPEKPSVIGKQRGSTYARTIVPISAVLSGATIIAAIVMIIVRIING